MPSHQERIAKQYNGICTRCLKNPIAFFASSTYMGINRTSYCEECLEKLRESLYFNREADA